MTNKIKILVLGIGQSNFLNQLYENVIQDNPSISIEIDGYFDISKGNSVDKKSIYDKYYDFKKINIKRVDLFLELIRFLFKKLSWQIIFFELSQNASFKQINKTVLNFVKAQYISKNHIVNGNFDIIHFHFCTPDNLIYLHFIPENTKSICSFWGSDLMRITGTSNVFYVQKALKKATTITIQTRELAEILYCKYGRELTDKVETLPFTISTDIYKKLDEYKSDTTAIFEFKKKHNIPQNKIIIAVSHNAFLENNHLQIIQEISSMNTELKNKLAILLPLGYGGTNTYKEKLIELSKTITDIEIIGLLDYFNPEDTALLRHATDVMIQMPISDALSGAMTEVLYAGNKVIAGSWLPYGILRRNGVEFIEIEDFEKLPKVLEEVVQQFDFEKNQVNAIKIKSFLFPDSTTPKWNALFKRVLDA